MIDWLIRNQNRTQFLVIDSVCWWWPWWVWVQQETGELSGCLSLLVYMLHVVGVSTSTTPFFPQPPPPPCSVVMVTGTACSFQRASSRLRGPRTGFFATERSDVELIMVGGVRWLTDEPGQKLSLSGWRAAALLLLLSHRHTATRKLQIRSHFKTSFMFSCFKCKDLFCEFLKVQINVSEMKLNTTVWKYKI